MIVNARGGSMHITGMSCATGTPLSTVMLELGLLLRTVSASGTSGSSIIDSTAVGAFWLHSDTTAACIPGGNDSVTSSGTTCLEPGAIVVFCALKSRKLEAAATGVRASLDSKTTPRTGAEWRRGEWRRSECHRVAAITRKARDQSP